MNSKKRYTDKRKTVNFRVVNNKNCPIYNSNDRFYLVDHFFSCSKFKNCCIILGNDLIEGIKNSENKITCSGCGIDREVTVIRNENIDVSKEKISIIEEVQKYSFFKDIRKSDIIEFADELEVTTFQAGDIIIEKGTKTDYLHIIISGIVNVLDDNFNIIDTFSEGTVFGENGVLANEVNIDTIQAVGDVTTIEIPSKSVKKLIQTFEKVREYFYKILIKKNTYFDVNKLEFKGKLSEWKVPDILQTLNMNKRSGILSIVTFNNTTKVVFYQGEIIEVTSNHLQGKEALYSLFNQEEGSFQYISDDSIESDLQPIGNFMQIMMEGLIKIDEEEL